MKVVVVHAVHELIDYEEIARKNETNGMSRLTTIELLESGSLLVTANS